MSETRPWEWTQLLPKIPVMQHVLNRGYVKLIEHMGSDEGIVEAARMSTGRGFVSWDPYERCKSCDLLFTRSKVAYPNDGTYTVIHHTLCYGPKACDGHTPEQNACKHEASEKFPRGDFGILETLYCEGHLTPFEFAQIHIEAQAPLMVFREWHRHRTQSYSEFSARYSQMPNLHYLPELSRVQKQSTTRKQGSGEALPEADAEAFLARIEEEQTHIYNTYDQSIERDGIAKELARINTPVSRYSKMRATADLRNWLAFCTLRLAPNAQFEIRQYAEAVGRVIAALYPKTWALFEEHTLGAVRFSKSEIAQLRAIFNHMPAVLDVLNFKHDVNQLDDRQRKIFLKKLGVRE